VLSPQATAGVTSPEEEPDLVARVLAAALVATVTGAVVTKLLGRKAGFVAFVLTASAHELLDAPLARKLSNLGL
jgi:hypothetical protein